ncbi:hypothetical protein, partial [Paraburkholderia sp. NMBU_R16]|uniref:hypothetical protein n=1 Tax=Paraburkholderia sp. NMBU_R16 TaxID=2698676 RepID=UPI001C2560F3
MQHAPSVNQQTLVSVNQHRHHQPRRDILILFVARLSSRLSRHIGRRFISFAVMGLVWYDETATPSLASLRTSP